MEIRPGKVPQPGESSQSRSAQSSQGGKSSQEGESVRAVPALHPVLSPHCNDRQIQAVERPGIPLAERSGIQVRPVTHNKSLLSEGFFEDCQALIWRFMHKPTSDGDRPPGSIARPVHGAMHTCRAAMWIPVLVSIRREMGDPDAINLPAGDLPFIMKAALLHDSGREGEGIDQVQWEKTSGEQCEDHLLVTHCRPELAAECRKGIINKDSKNKSFIAKLIHDADCLEIMRVPEGNRFDIKRLDLFQDFKNEPRISEVTYQLASRVREVIASQGDLCGNTRIINSEDGHLFKEETENIHPQQYSESEKERFEFADNALLHQLAALETVSPELYKLCCESLVEPAFHAGKIDPLAMIQLPEPGEVGAGRSVTGPCLDKETGLKYFIKEHHSIDSAKNEVLMTRLARELGVTVPDVHLIKKEGRTFVVSLRPEGLRQDPEALSGCNPDQLASLYLVASVLGNADVVGDSFDKTLLNRQGAPVAVDWGEAGEFGAPGASQRKVDSFGPTVFELDSLRTGTNPPDHKTCSKKSMTGNAVTVFQALEEKDILQAARNLLNRDIGEVSRLLERFGPDAPFDRQRLQRTIHERLAYVARRFPAACAGRITPVEQAAIRASGVDGYSIPVSSQDITDGDLRIYHCYNQNNQAISECWLKLTPQAARQFAGDRLGLPPRFHHQLIDIRNYAAALLGSPAMTQEWRLNLEHMMGLCQATAQELEQHSERLSCSGTTEDIPAVIKQLTDLGMHCQLLLSTVRDGQSLSLMPGVSLPRILPEGFPARVSSIDFERQDTSFRLRQLRYDRAWELDKNDTLKGIGQPCYINSRSFLPETLACVDIEWFSDDMPEAYALEGILKLRIPGQGLQASHKLLDALQHIGIDITRPGNSEVQEQYIDALIDCYCFSPEIPEAILALDDNHERHRQKVEWLLPRLELKQEPRWEHNHRAETGRLIFLRPDNPLEPAPDNTEYVPIHQLDFMRTQFRDDVLIKILHSGGHLSSMAERLRMGIQLLNPASMDDDLKSGGSCSVFIRAAHKNHPPHYGLVLKQEVLRRTDICPYTKDLRGTKYPSKVRLYRKRPRPDIWQSVADEPFNDISLYSSLSLAQVDSVKLPLPKRKPVAAELEAVMTTWPDGRPWRQVVPTDVSQEYFTKCYARLTGPSTPLSANDKACVSQLGKKYMPALLENNPELLNGKLESLWGLKKHVGERMIFHNVDFSNIQLPFDEQKWIEFHNCKIANIDFYKVNCFSLKFFDCKFENVRFDPAEIGCLFRIQFSDPDAPDCKDRRDFLYDFCQNNYDSPFMKFRAVGNVGLFPSRFYQNEIDTLCVDAIDNWLTISERYGLHEDQVLRCIETACRLRKKNPSDRKILPLIAFTNTSGAATNAHLFLKNNDGFLYDNKALDFKGVYFKKGQNFKGIDLSGYSFDGASFEQDVFSQDQMNFLNGTKARLINCRVVRSAYIFATTFWF